MTSSTEAQKRKIVRQEFSALLDSLSKLLFEADPIASPDYWNGKDATPQLDGAFFEIACWDSSATILINLPAEAQRRFIAAYSDTRPLSEARGK